METMTQAQHEALTAVWEAGGKYNKFVEVAGVSGPALAACIRAGWLRKKGSTASYVYGYSAYMVTTEGRVAMIRHGK